MNDSSLHPLARDYLKRLNKAAANLPRARRKELIGEIESHLSEALPVGASEAETLNVLERLGEPADIAAEAASGATETLRPGMRESLAVILLLFGGFLVGVGWFVGIHLLWSSRFWTTRDKLVGTLLVPGGLLPAVVLAEAGVQTCHGGTGVPTECTPYVSPTLRVVMIAGLIALIVLPLISAVFLSWRSGRSRIALS
ncbi:MAG: hypothetical protein ABSC36_00495 [Gaiellaceae bacterium]|jgi:hypothetical protein